MTASSIIIKLAREAGIAFTEEHIEICDRNHIRVFHATSKELTRFAELVGKMAREDERKKLTNQKVT